MGVQSTPAELKSALPSNGALAISTVKTSAARIRELALLVLAVTCARTLEKIVTW